MASPAQINANTLNAQLSTGPKTEAGKANSKLNAFRHGLTGGTVVLRTEDMELYQRFCAEIIISYEAVGLLEQQLAQILSDTYWRLDRIPTLESNIFALAQLEPLPEHLAALDEGLARTALIQANALIKHERQFRNLHLQEQRLHRLLKTTTAQLAAIQTNRQDREAEIGFEFSNPAQPSLKPARPQKFPSLTPSQPAMSDKAAMSDNETCVSNDRKTGSASI